MNSMRIASQRIIYAVAAFAMIVAIVLPAIASAAQISTRSIALSNASAGATDVTYNVSFTPVSDAGAFTIDFCSNTPLFGETCTAPTGFDASAASVGGTAVSSATANRIVVESAMTASTEVAVEIQGIDNPTADGVLYARVATYANTTDATTYEAAPVTATNPGDYIDNGGVALSITPTIGVSGVVLETLSFCVSGAAIDADCANTTAPVLELGETVGTVKALQAGIVSTGNIFTQISTNAAGGVVVHLKSSAAGCGGLLLAGAPESCYIVPVSSATATDILPGSDEAMFGVMTDAASTSTSGVDSATGVLQPVATSGYNATTYALNYNDTDESTGVTSTFGDPFLDTNNAPVNNQNLGLTFGATITNNTPAGTYSADLSLIAVGKF